MTPIINRVDPSLLHHGAVIFMGDMPDVSTAELFTDLFIDNTGQTFAYVDYLIRDEADNYVIVPVSPLSLGELAEKGLLIDTRHVKTVRRLENTKNLHTAPVVPDLYSELLNFDHRTMSGVEMMEVLKTWETPAKLRPKNRFILIPMLADFIVAQLLKHHPRPRCFINRYDVQQKLFASRTLQTFVKVFFETDGPDELNPVFVSVNMKAMRKWLKRNQSMFYTSSEKHQRVIDEFDQAALIAEQADAEEALREEMELSRHDSEEARQAFFQEDPSEDEHAEELKEEEDTAFNSYRHDGCSVQPGVSWSGEYATVCNDHCPACGEEVSPFNSSPLENTRD